MIGYEQIYDLRNANVSDRVIVGTITYKFGAESDEDAKEHIAGLEECIGEHITSFHPNAATVENQGLFRREVKKIF
ncbi:hypothetical protein GOV12_01685 [Candidatus Pacearchaeota archaeon]|nr:hypothetical protein [Candidatus Pacearchaeota archaeon]